MAHGLSLQFASSIGRHTHRGWLQANSPVEGLALPTLNPDWEHHALKRSSWSIPVPPRLGRFYPSRLQSPDLPVPQFRVTGLTANDIGLDFNPPITRFTPELHRMEEVGLPDGLLSPAQLLAWVGMETPCPGVATDFNDAGGFERDDENSDAEFYAEPRLLTHIDTQCIARLELAYRILVPEGSRVLDLMSSLHSHLPAGTTVTGLGMNAEELRHNVALSDYCLQDLNEQPQLPWPEDSFDVVVISLSIEYLRLPATILADIRRVLCPGGQLLISFSNRYFPTKAINLWKHLHPMERLGWVLQLLRTSGYMELRSLVERGLPRPADDRYSGQFPESDPLFLVQATAP